jgi:hypothetical protein
VAPTEDSQPRCVLWHRHPADAAWAGSPCHPCPFHPFHLSPRIEPGLEIGFVCTAAFQPTTDYWLPTTALLALFRRDPGYVPSPITPLLQSTCPLVLLWRNWLCFAQCVSPRQLLPVRQELALFVQWLSNRLLTTDYRLWASVCRRWILLKTHAGPLPAKLPQAIVSNTEPSILLPCYHTSTPIPGQVKFPRNVTALMDSRPRSDRGQTFLGAT